MERIEQSVGQPSEAVLDSEWLSLSKSEQMQQDYDRYWDSARRMSAFDALQQTSEKMTAESEIASRQNLGIATLKFTFPRHRA